MRRPDGLKGVLRDWPYWERKEKHTQSNASHPPQQSHLPQHKVRSPYSFPYPLSILSEKIISSPQPLASDQPTNQPTESPPRLCTAQQRTDRQKTARVSSLRTSLGRSISHTLDTHGTGTKEADHSAAADSDPSCKSHSRLLACHIPTVGVGGLGLGLSLLPSFPAFPS